MDNWICLEGNFLDDLPETEKQIRNCVSSKTFMIRQDAEALIGFMKKLMSAAK